MLEQKLRDRIAAVGPIRFDEFMRAALYDPEFGYYRRPPRDPFGKHGDFFTATQIQPLFGLLVAEFIRPLLDDLPTDERHVFDLGAGRAEMAPAFGQWRYHAIDFGREELPASFSGMVFANEFFDALPVRVGERNELLVARDGDRFTWSAGNEPLAPDWADRYWPQPRGRFEYPEQAMQWIARIAKSLVRGWVVIVDYAVTTRETLRFPEGTLMSYRRHVAGVDVLSSPGERDITSHVHFDALADAAQAAGLAVERRLSLGELLIEALERLPAAVEHREQLKTLLYGMGESFRVLVLKRKKAPVSRGL